MKRLICLFFFITISILGFAQEKPKVVATATMIWDMAKQIGGDHFDIQCIVPIGGDPHTYDPTPGDARMVSAANLILKNGLTFEGWLDELIENSGTKATTIRVTDGIQPITSLTYKNSADPHAWMDVSFAIKYVENIKNAFSALLPEQANTFENNYTAYVQKLSELDAYITEKIKSVPEGKRFLITSHDAFQYYGRRYNIKLEAILGTSTDAEAQTSDIIRLNKVIKENQVPAVFIESTINPKLLKQLAKDNNIIIGGQLYADSIGDEDSDAPTYIDMMKHNTDTIVAGLLHEPEEHEPADEEPANFWLYGLIAFLFIGGFVFIIKRMNRDVED